MANKANYHLLATSRSELRAPSNFFTPQSLRDSPRWGHWGPDSPDPLRRFALRAHFFSPPSHFVTAPWGALGTGFPRPLASLRSEFEDFYPNISPPLTGPRVATVARR